MFVFPSESHALNCHASLVERFSDYIIIAMAIVIVPTGSHHYHRSYNCVTLVMLLQTTAK